MEIDKKNNLLIRSNISGSTEEFDQSIIHYRNEDSHYSKEQHMSDIFLYKIHFKFRKEKFYKRFSQKLLDKNDMHLGYNVYKYKLGDNYDRDEEKLKYEEEENNN